jgi:hypothetical protein
MTPAAERAGPQDDLSWPDYLTRLEQANIANSLDNLLTFPGLRKLIESGRVAPHGAYFGVAAGELSIRDETSGEFLPVAGARSNAALSAAREGYAALRLAVISLRLIRHSAIWMALSAAPLRKLSETIHIASPFSTVASSRMRLM